MKRVIILPLDGYENGQVLLSALTKLLDSPGLSDLLAYIKVNDAVHNKDFGGPALVDDLRFALENRGVPAGIFLDLKITDVSATMVNTLKKYASCNPEILTVSSLCSVEGIMKLRQLLPNTKLALVSVPTDIGEEECRARYGQGPAVKIYNDLESISEIYKYETGKWQHWPETYPFDFVVCSPRELAFLKKNLPEHYGFIVPGIRDEWMKKAIEHQKRTTGVKEALDLGATFVVMGTQLTKGNTETGISAEKSCFLTQQQISFARERYGDDPLEVLKNCGGYYVSPQDDEGKYLGPLVAYAGTYQTDEEPKNFVGFEYFNFSKAECNPVARAYFAQLIGKQIKENGILCDVLLGAPMGGILLATQVGNYLDCRTIFSEKKITALPDLVKGRKEESQQIIDRHEIRPGDNVVIVEDVCNNFSTTEKLKQVVEANGGTLTAICCAFNRSGKQEWNGIPVLSSLSIEAKQFKQDDPEVAELVSQNQIVFKPKFEWAKLKEAMGV